MRFRFVPLFALCMLTCATAKPTSQPAVASPRYQSWAGHLPGTTVTMKCVNEASGRFNRLELVYVLRIVTPTFVGVECTTTIVDGAKTRALPTSKERIESTEPPLAADDGKAVGEEDVVIAGTKYHTTHRAHASTMDGRPLKSDVWTSPDMPGLNVKLTIVDGEGAAQVKSQFVVAKVELK